MSRMGDTIRSNRLKYKLTEKQLAKKTGLAESFIKEVESGRRIPSDDQVKRLLKACGVTESMSTEIDTFNAVEEKPRPRPRPYIIPVEKPSSPEKVSEQDEESSAAWLDALGGVVKRVPILDENGLVIDHMLFPVVGGKIEGGTPDKVTLFRVPDGSLSGFQVRAGDLFLCVPEKTPVDDAFMLVHYGGKRLVRRIKKLDSSHLMLQSYDRELRIDSMLWGEIQLLARCVRLIRSL
ncbi:MAG: helix-turn-helix transcriptional regulator [Clostridiales bacterium]|nr:helix-turn-helix transcriptional regulator [Clostridiales bacterium]